jgi:hypothetical protein
MLGDLSEAPRALAKLKEQGAASEALIDALLAAFHEQASPNARLPTAKALQQRSGLKPAAFKQQLEALYQAYLNALEQQLDFIEFKRVEYCLVIDGRRAPLAIRCQLPVAPQLGEGLDLDFVNGATGGGAYYVDHIASEYTEGLITVYVHLKPGYFDPYLWQLRARARFEGKLPYNIEREMGEYEVQDYLRKLYGASPAVPVPNREAPRRHWS